jgi:hypothetical protein
MTRDVRHGIVACMCRMSWHGTAARCTGLCATDSAERDMIAPENSSTFTAAYHSALASAPRVRSAKQMQMNKMKKK